jgi:hypothetical protein
MTLRPAVLLAALHLDEQKLFAAALADDFAFNARALEERLADPDLSLVGVTFAAKEHLIELDRRTDRAIELLDLDDIAGLNAILLPTCLNHCVHSPRKLP